MMHGEDGDPRKDQEDSDREMTILGVDAAWVKDETLRMMRGHMGPPLRKEQVLRKGHKVQGR